MTVVDISTADNGARVEVRPGDAIVLRLPDNPTTGYRWQLIPVDGDILALDDEGSSRPGPGWVPAAPPRGGCARCGRGPRLWRPRGGAPGRARRR